MRSIAITSVLLLLACIPVLANEFSGTRFLKISTADQAAVVKKTDGKLQLLKVGDMVDAETRIIAFEENHAILERPGEWGPTKYIVDVLAGQMHITRMARRPLEKHHFGKGEVKSFNTSSQ